MEKIRIHMIGNTHIDPVWLWEKAEGMQEVKSSFISALDRLDEFPEFYFTQSSIAFLQWMKDNCPEQFERIRQKVAEGRWNIVGGMWIEPDCDIPSGESMVRHFLYSKKFVKENFGKDVVTTYNVDSFGHGSNMPAICSGCGIKYYLMSRPDKKHVEVPPVFRWESMDGSSVIAERTCGEYMAWTRPAIETNLQESLEALEKYQYDKMAVFYGVGNHGGGPTIDNIKTVKELIRERTDLEMSFSTIDAFFESVSTDDLPTVKREMGRIFYGCYSSDGEIKALNRRAEGAMLTAEALCTMASRLGVKYYRYPAVELERAWKSVLFNQFHDVLAGTSIEPARNFACLEFGSAIAMADTMRDCAVQAMANAIDTRGEGFPLLLFNPTGSDYKGLYAASVYVPRAEKKGLRLKDFKEREISYATSEYRNYAKESRKVILFDAEVPAFGYSMYHYTTEGPDSEIQEDPMRATTLEMDNGYLHVTFDPGTGAPASMKIGEKELLKEPVSYCVYQDDRGAWGEFVLKEEKCGRFEVQDSKVLEVNHKRMIVRYLLAYHQSEMMVDYILENHSDQLKMNMKLRNGEKQKLISMNVPVAAENPRVWNETAFLAENKVDCKDENPENYQHRFADIEDEKEGSGLAVLNNGIYAFSQKESEYRLILLRNSSFARGGRGELPDNLEGSFMNQTTFDFRISLLVHAGSLSKKRLFEEADFMQMPVVCLADSQHSGEEVLRQKTLADITSENVHISCLKEAADGSGEMVFRFFETEGKEGSITLTEQDEQMEFTVEPYAIRTIRRTPTGFRLCDMTENLI